MRTASLRGISHCLEQTGIARTAHRQPGAIGEDRDATLLAIGLDARDPLQVHDGGSMNANEAGGVERSLEVGDGLLLEVRFAAAVQRHIIVLRLGIIELIKRNNMHAGAILNYSALWPLGGRARV